MTEGRLTKHGRSALLHEDQPARITKIGRSALIHESVPGRVTKIGRSALISEAVPARITRIGRSALIKSPLTAGCVTTIATCWKIVRTDGITKRFTTHDRDLVVPLDGTYKTCNSVDPTASELSADLASGGLDVEGIIDSNEISESDLRAGRYDFATFKLFKVDWSDLTRSPMEMVTGRVGEIKFGHLLYEAQLRTVAQQMQQQIVDVYKPTCRFAFGSPQCGVNLASHTFASTVTSVTSRRVFYVSSLGATTGMFKYGKVTFTTGSNAGLARDIKAFNAGEIELWEQTPYDIGVGDGVSVVRGCDLEVETCENNYSNINNFGGFRTIPGVDSVLDHPNAKA